MPDQSWACTSEAQPRAPADCTGSVETAGGRAAPEPTMQKDYPEWAVCTMPHRPTVRFLTVCRELLPQSVTLRGRRV
ncbi:hypothetical protein GCM10023107_14480 [Actinoplanes octamycinicus]|nr:hypothetical protein Aoc01nite_18410 [Actinoplanes octamycinicus]